jgi:glycosyltransferase domain-containing protein
MNKDLTIVIPIYNSKNYLTRTLEYLNANRCSYKIFISDGCREKKFNLLYLKKKYQNLVIEYHYFGHDYSFDRFLKKMYQTLILIKSKYVYWLCDDDFVNLRTLDFGIKILKSSIGIFFGGRVETFQISNQENTRFKFANKNYQYKNLTSFEKKNLKSDFLINRFRNIMNFQPYEGIFLKNVLLEVFYLSKQLKTFDEHSFAFLFKCVPLYSGKIFFFNKTILYKQTNTFDSQGSILASNISTNIKKYYYGNLQILSKKLLVKITKKHKLSEKNQLFLKLIFNKYILDLSNYLLILIYNDYNILINKKYLKLIFILKKLKKLLINFTNKIISI